MTNIFRLAFVLALVVFLSACSHTKGGGCINPAAPGCGNGDNGGGNGGGEPDQTGLEPLGDAAPKHYLIDSVTKAATSMWVKLLWVNPARRSILTYGNLVCPAKCFQLRAEVGKDAEPPRKATILFYWSDDCVNPWPGRSGNVGGGIVAPGESKIVGDGYVYFFDSTPKCLLADGEHFRNEGGRVRGTYPLVLDYQDPR